jgi:hypothetical protein
LSSPTNKRRCPGLAALTLLAFPAAAVAYPEGAPWGAAVPDAQENCSTCHFDYDAKPDSTSIRIDGLPKSPSAGETYEFVVRFEDPGAAVAGFQLLARASAGNSGTFSSPDAATETGDSAIRSTKPSINDDGVAWRIAWTAPDTPGAIIHLFLAVTAANDDGSPFGDQVHFHSYSVQL